jgi:hypothetical protein
VATPKEVKGEFGCDRSYNELRYKHRSARIRIKAQNNSPVTNFGSQVSRKQQGRGTLYNGELALVICENQKRVIAVLLDREAYFMFGK